LSDEGVKVTIITTVSGKRIRIKRQKSGPKPLPLTVKKRHVNISLSPYWHERGKALAAAEDMSFSAFWKDWWYMLIRCVTNQVNIIVGTASCAERNLIMKYKRRSIFWLLAR
jgi:hypothetical protein